jgi:UDP-N-acetylmuramoyl-L-alanyl-D-glutamate--2,6-diaminopimelate ligase
MKLRELLAHISPVVLPVNHPAMSLEVKGLSTNSHACQPGDLFIGMPGTRVDGGDFWESAIASGAIAALVSQPIAEKYHQTKACLVAVADVVKASAQLAAAFYDYPTQKMQLVGVTGTNGKTTTTHLIEFFLAQAQFPTALIGTLYTRWPGFQETAAHTTPFATDLQQQFAAAVAAGCQMTVMEVSSHALAQGRITGCSFEVAVFTNLTQDHLDYHKDMESYFAAKAMLFDSNYLQGRAVINKNDPYGQRLIAQLPPEQVWSYSINDSTANLWMGDLQYQPNGVSGILHSPQGDAAFESPLVGQYNLENLLAAIGAILHLGLDLKSALQALPNFLAVPGRMERVQISPTQDISVVVDYAHTPDSLENLLRAAKPFIPGKTICVFGCGGDRDRTKRPIMGKIAANLADLVVVTSDNPRTEDPDKILQDILAGIPPETNLIVNGDRAAAIRTAILHAQPGDGVLIAGKGHEDYQILGTEKIHFDDREQARIALESR